MQFTISAAFLALIGSAFAQTANFDAITAPTKNQELVADGKQSYKITWEPTVEYNGQAVSILLLQGASQDTLDFYPGAKVACTSSLHPNPATCKSLTAQHSKHRQRSRHIYVDSG